MEQSVVLDSILGYPDNMKITKSGDLWIGIPSFRDHVTDLLDGSVLVRKILLNLRVPTWLFMGAANMKYSGGIKVNPKAGKIIDYFFGKTDSINFVTSIQENNGKVYLASLFHGKIGVADLGKPSP